MPKVRGERRHLKVGDGRGVLAVGHYQNHSQRRQDDKGKARQGQRERRFKVEDDAEYKKGQRRVKSHDDVWNNQKENVVPAVAKIFL